MNANIYLANEVIGCFKGDVAPESDFWNLLLQLQGCSGSIFRQRMSKVVGKAGETSGNAQFEFVWVPLLPPANSEDLDDWCGKILVREPDLDVLKKLPNNISDLPYTPMSSLYLLEAMANRSRRRSVKEDRRNGVREAIERVEAAKKPLPS